MSHWFKCLSCLLMGVTLVGCAGEPQTPKPQDESAQGVDAPQQGSDTNTEVKSSSGSDSR